MKRSPKTLDTTWKYCVQLWTDIKTARLKGREEPVGNLKEIWMKLNGFGGIYNDCFFCNWAEEEGIGVDNPDIPGGCPNCPGVKVDPNFCCQGDIHWRDDPIEFANYIIKLNQKRLRRGKKR